MAFFIGTKKEFHRYLGPRIRNVVQRITISEKSNHNKTCQHCKRENIELESAHVHGKDRKLIIESIIDNYSNGEQVNIDIEQIENQIINSHNPISETFLFLCRECHKKYDDEEIIHKTIATPAKLIESKQGNSSSKNDINEQDQEFRKVQNRLPNWFRNKDQYNSKILYAYLKLYAQNQEVNYYDLKRESELKSFDSNFNQMKNFSANNHGKIFEQVGDIVYLWDKTESLVLSMYEQFK